MLRAASLVLAVDRFRLIGEGLAGNLLPPFFSSHDYDNRTPALPTAHKSSSSTLNVWALDLPRKSKWQHHFGVAGWRFFGGVDGEQWRKIL